MDTQELETKLLGLEERHEVLKMTAEAFMAKTNRTVGDIASQPELAQKLAEVGDGIVDAIYRNKQAIDELRGIFRELYIKDYQDVMVAKGEKTERFILQKHPVKDPVVGCVVNMYVNGLRYFQGKEFLYDAETNTVSWNNQESSTTDPGNSTPWEIASNSLVVFEYKVKAEMPTPSSEG